MHFGSGIIDGRQQHRHALAGFQLPTAAAAATRTGTLLSRNAWRANPTPRIAGLPEALNRTQPRLVRSGRQSPFRQPEMWLKRHSHPIHRSRRIRLLHCILTLRRYGPRHTSFIGSSLEWLAAEFKLRPAGLPGLRSAGKSHDRAVMRLRHPGEAHESGPRPRRKWLPRQPPSEKGRRPNLSWARIRWRVWPQGLFLPVFLDAVVFLAGGKTSWTASR